jgi:hypothetical protein
VSNTVLVAAAAVMLIVTSPLAMPSFALWSREERQVSLRQGRH